MECRDREFCVSVMNLTHENLEINNFKYERMSELGE